MKISTKSILVISALTSSFFLIYSSYKGTVLYFVNEALEDTFVGGSTSDVAWSSVGLDVEWVRLPVVVLDGLGGHIKVPLLGSDIVSPSLEPDIVSTVAFC